MLATGTTKRFIHAPCGEPPCEYAALTGTTVTIERALTAQEADPEVGTMYRVALRSGQRFDAFEDELS